MERDSFIFYRSFFESMQGLKDKEQLQIFNAICELALNEKEVKLTGVSKNIFTVIKPQILANSKRYESGKKGGRPKKETIGFQKEKTIGFENKKPNKNVNENVNVNVNENENDNVSDSCVDGLQEVINFYENNIGLITPHAAEVLEDFLEEMNYEVVIFAMKKAVEANVRTIQYIKGTLNNWNKKGIKTLIEAEEESQNFRKKTSAEEEFLNG